MKNWGGLNKDLDPNDIDDSQSPDCENCRHYATQKGTLGPRLGFTAVNSTGFSGTVVGLAPYRLPFSGGNYWATALDSGSSVTVTFQSALWQDIGVGGAIPAAATTLGCGSSAVAADVQLDLLGTSSTFAYTLTTPHGTFTLNTAEVDAAAVKTATLGCLTVTYSGASRGSRGIIYIRGLFSRGEYSHSFTKTGTIADSSSCAVYLPCHYTSASEGYNNASLAFGAVVASLLVLNTPVTFAA